MTARVEMRSDSQNLIQRMFAPGPLYWALTASTLVHAGIAGIGLARHDARPLVVPVPAVIQASLVDVAPTPAPPEDAEVIDVPAVVLSAEPVAAAVEPLLPKADPIPLPTLTPAAAAPVVQASSDALIDLDIQVEAKELAAHERVGDFAMREQSEFPVEVDFPVRWKEPIRAEYPATARARGVESSVVAWAVIDETGHAEEIHVLDDPPEFTDAVAAAIRQAEFIPARNNLKPIRFPVALEFDFQLGHPSTASTAATDARATPAEAQN